MSTIESIGVHSWWILSSECPYLLCNVALGLKIFRLKKKIVRNLPLQTAWQYRTYPFCLWVTTWYKDVLFYLNSSFSARCYENWIFKCESKQKKQVSALCIKCFLYWRMGIDVSPHCWICLWDVPGKIKAISIDSRTNSWKPPVNLIFTFSGHL